MSHSTAIEASRLSLFGRIAGHGRRSLPPLTVALLGTAGWVLVMVGSALAGITWLGWQTPEKFAAVALLYGFGAAIAFAPALFLARFVSRGRPAEAAFAAMFVALALLTICSTGGLFGLYYRSYYSTWHDDFGTITWVFQFVFTMGTSLVQFSVLGVRLYFPIGFVALFVAAFWFARHAR